MTMKLFSILLLSTAAFAEVRTLTLRQCLEVGAGLSPEVALARMDELIAQQAVRLARDPFTPRVTVGSGLAYSNGFPMSIDGAAPSIVQARATQFLFNRQQTYVVAQARETARGAAITTAAKRDEVAFRVATLYLDAERAARIAGLARKELESLETVAQTVEASIAEGRELPLEGKKAQYNVARARQVIESLEGDAETAETNLAIALGMTADDRVRPAAEERPAPALPASEDEAVRTALESSKDLRRMQSQITAKELQVRGEKAARLPRVDLVAQYGLLARYNNYEDYYRSFQRNNGQLGLSFQLPLFTGPGIKAQVAQTQTEISRLRLEFGRARNRIAADLRQAYREVHKAETAREVARLDLEVVREQLSVALAQMHEGRVTLRSVEETRVAENDKWIAFYDAQYGVERARWNALHQTGELLAWIASPTPQP
jgi:outer membrane protein